MRTDDQRNGKQIAQVKQLLDAGSSAAAAARALNLSRQRVAQIIKDYLPTSYAGRRTRTAAHSGKAAQAGGKLVRGRLQVVCYPRPKTKAVLVQAAKKAKLPLANFLVLSALESAGATNKIPESELNALLRA